MKIREKRIKLGNKIIKITTKAQIIFSIIILITCLMVGFILTNSSNNDWALEAHDFSNLDTSPTLVPDSGPTLVADSPKETSICTDDSKILIHVSGAVKNPGIVNIYSHSRVNDAINAAGGITKNADINNINLADFVYDGMKIHVPHIGETPYISQNTSSPGNNHQGNNNSTTSKINVNTASINDLKKLAGIGSSTAEKIIAYREKNGPYKAIEDIKNVSGIGEAKFNNIKAYICV